MLAGVLLSLAACAASFVLLYRLARERLGTDGARRAVLYLAVFPTALFLQAVYSESLYLLLVLAAFLLAERGRFLGAGVVTGLAMLTRPVGIALLPALAVLAWRSEDRRGALLRLSVSVLVAATYPLLLAIWIDEPFAFLRAQDGIWQRELSPLGPLGGLWDGIAVLFADRPARDDALNVQQLAFTLLFLGLAALAWRRFGAPYGLFALLSLAIPLSFPVGALAAALDVAVRARALPAPARAGRPRRSASPPCRSDGGLRRAPRRRRGAMGPVAMGGMSNGGMSNGA